MTKFRVGDVVRVNDGVPHHWGREARVEKVLPAGSGMTEVVGLRLPSDRVGSPAAFSPSELTLLRRPVREGDVLCESGRPCLVVRADSRFVLNDSWHEYRYSPSDFARMLTIAGVRFTHADGTPIDPPQSLVEVGTQGAGAMACAACGFTDGPFVRHHNGARLCFDAFGCGERKRAAQGVGAEVIGVDPAVPGSEATVFERVHVKLPAVEQLASALFASDPRVVAFVERVADGLSPRRGTNGIAEDLTDYVREERALNRAYARGIFGFAPEMEWARDAWSRAEAVLDVLRGMK